MENHSFNDIGQQFKDCVTEALATGDFSPLNDLVNDTVNKAVGEAKSQFEAGAANARQKSHDAQSIHDERAQKTSKQQAAKAVAHEQKRSRYDYRRRPDGSYGANTDVNNEQSTVLATSERPFKKVGSISGTLQQVFGSIGIGLSSLGVILFTIFGLLFSAKGLFFGTFAMLCMGVFAGVLLGNGTSAKNRLSRAKRYLQLCGKNAYINIKELEIHTGKSRKYLLKDIKKMIQKGVFPQGHLDMQEECLMLNDETYQEYLNLEKRKKQLMDSESKVLAAESGKDLKASPNASGDEELDEMIAEGRKYIRQLRELNDEIEGEVISAKLFKLEDVLKDIFDRLAKHPEHKSKMHKMMSYYLPTTIKLVEAYKEFDGIESPSSDMVEAKAEIENTLDTINAAFLQLRDNLFRDAAYDVTTDAQVLKTMLAREGFAADLVKEPVE